MQKIVQKIGEIENKKRLVLVIRNAENFKCSQKGEDHVIGLLNKWRQKSSQDWLLVHITYQLKNMRQKFQGLGLNNFHILRKIETMGAVLDLSANHWISTPNPAFIQWILENRRPHKFILIQNGSQDWVFFFNFSDLK